MRDSEIQAQLGITTLIIWNRKGMGAEGMGETSKQGKEMPPGPNMS